MAATAGDYELVVGPAAGWQLLAAAPDEDATPEARSDSFAGFYNGGLTLYETTQLPLLRLQGLRFKVNSSRLQHTLSRDNVRHDSAFEQAPAAGSPPRAKRGRRIKARSLCLWLPR